MTHRQAVVTTTKGNGILLYTEKGTQQHREGKADNDTQTKARQNAERERQIIIHRQNDSTKQKR